MTFWPRVSHIAGIGVWLSVFAPIAMIASYFVGAVPGIAILYGFGIAAFGSALCVCVGVIAEIQIEREARRK